MGLLLLLLLGISRRQCHPIGQLSIQTDLECVLAGAGQRDIEYQDGAGLDVDDSRRRLAELDRAFPTEQLIAALVYEPDPNGMNPDLGPAAAHPEHQMGSRIDRGKIGEPDVLKHAQHAELALLVDQGVVGDDRKVEVQLS
jgi:hypothetical protein